MSLTFSSREDIEDRPAPPKIIWHHTESGFIQVAKCDILTIMDSCFAGGVTAAVKETNGYTHEYLGACEANSTTPAPGPDSFTRALIASLQRLLKERRGQSFTTLDLQRVLTEEQKNRAKSPKQVKKGILLTRSSENRRRIELRPLKSEEPYFTSEKVHSYLNLRIELLQETLTYDELGDLAKRVSEAVRESKAKTRRVDHLGQQPRGKPSFQKTISKVKTIQGTFGMKSLLQIATDDAVADAQDRRPGIYAVFGWISPRFHPHKLIILLYRPWPLLMLGVLVMLALARLLTNLGVLEVLRSTAH